MFRMKSKMMKIFWCCILIVAMLFNFGACGDSYSTQKEESKEAGVSSSAISVEELRDDDEIYFSDFLVERCVRKTLNKSWDDKITKADAASVKSLLIDPIYNPSIGINNSPSPSFYFYEGHIDLVDLKYLTGLEILKIDNLVNYDMVVNVDCISNCKKLKRLYMQWNPTLYNPCSGIGYGYRYWADIIGELPDLEYVDLGIYVDSHMKEIMLSKTSNKQITFYNGYNDRYATQLLNTALASYSNPMTVITDVWQYESTMKYEYNGNDIDLNSDTQSMLGKIPIIEVDSYDDLQQKINRLSDTTEDLCISLWKECTEFDCNLLSKFKKLNTLTIVKSGTYLYYSAGRYELVKLKNTDKITEIPHLQVINLGACRGDISFLKNVKDLRELALSACDITGINALGKAERLTEFKIFQSRCGNIKSEFAAVEGNNLKKLKYYRCFGNDEIMTNYMAALEYMPKLQTLSVPTDIPDLSVLKCCNELENLDIWGYMKEKEYNIKEIVSLSKLKTVCIYVGKIVNASEILNMPNIVSVVLPKAVNNIDSTEVNMLIKSAAVHNKLSMFAIINGPSGDYTKDEVAKFDKAGLKLLYDEGIYDGFVQARITSRWDNKKEEIFEDAWLEIQNN